MTAGIGDKAAAASVTVAVFGVATVALYWSAYVNHFGVNDHSQRFSLLSWFATATFIVIVPRLLISLLSIFRGGSLFVAGAYAGFATSYVFLNWLGSTSSDKLGVVLLSIVGLFTGMAGTAAGLAIRQHQRRLTVILLCSFVPVLAGSLLPLALAVLSKY